MPTGSSQDARPSAAIDAAGLDHVRLIYHYLDRGDVDGFASLLHEDARVRRPGAEPIRGREAIERSAHPRGRHLVHGMFASGARVAVTGRFVGDVDAEFADIFTVSDCGLLTTQTRYFFTPPR